MSQQKRMVFPVTFTMVLIGHIVVSCGSPARIPSHEKVKIAKEVRKVPIVASIKPPEKSIGSGDSVLELTKIREVRISGAPLQVKSIELLKSSLASCSGDPKSTELKDEMVLNPGEEKLLPDLNGRRPFLLQSVYTSQVKVGETITTVGNVTQVTNIFKPVLKSQDVFDFEKPNLYDASRAGRGTAGGDALTSSLLMSLGSIAAVVAWNCDPNSSQSCNCSTESFAREIFSRCLPSVSLESSEATAALKEFTEMCNTSDVYKRRKAFGSLLGSYAFAVAR